MEKIIHYCWFGDKPLPKLAKKCIKSWEKYLPDFKIIKWSEDNVDLNECAFIKGAYEAKKWAFVADYARTKALKEYGGIYLDTDMEITKDIASLLENDTFLGIEDTGFVAVGVWWEKNKNSILSTELLETYRKIDKFDENQMSEISIPKMISKILAPMGLKYGVKRIQNLENNITIYPRDYFYPYSFNRDNNIFTDNTCMIHYYDASWIPKSAKKEMYMVRFFGQRNSDRIYKVIRLLKLIIKNCLKVPLFPIVIYRNHKRKMTYIDDIYLNRIDETVQSIKENKDKEYITIYNKLWLGVANATKENFENLVDCDSIHRKKDAKQIANVIIDCNIKQVVFSAFALGWADIAKYLKKKDKNIKIKTFWHGSNSQVLDTYGWERNLEIIKLHKKGIIDVMGTCKESLVDFYKKQGYIPFFISNKVSVKVDKKLAKKNNKKKIIGIYAAKCDDWRKNMYSQMAAVGLMENAVIDMVPLNDNAKKFAETYGIEITGVEKAISREELLQRMGSNDVNLYVTFSECAPMLPLESMTMGVPCITGNNHHYFENNELAKYIVVNNEVDINEIKNKIELCIKNKDKIINLYNKFSIENNKLNKAQVDKFLKI